MDKKKIIKRERTLVRLKPASSSISNPLLLDPSEFNWPTTTKKQDGGEKIGETRKVADEKKWKKKSTTVAEELINALQSVPSAAVKTKIGDLKKRLKTATRQKGKITAGGNHPQGPLRAPIADRERERLEREAAYARTTEELGDWDEVVRRNRLSDTLEFPLQSAESLKLYTNNSTVEEKIRQFEPRGRLERETAAVFASSKHNLRNDAPYTEAEREILAKSGNIENLEQAKERRARLQKMRALVSYAERKLRWQNKIKSKRYRRLVKRRDKRQAEAEFRDLLDQDPQAAMEKLELLERDRIKERATLKHRSTGKWAKQVRHLAKKDPRLREALQEQLRRGRELAEKKRTAEAKAAAENGKDEDDDEEQEDESDREDGGEKEKKRREKWAAAQPILDVNARLITNTAEPADDDDDDSSGSGDLQEKGGKHLLGQSAAARDQLMAEAFAEDDVMEEFRAELSADIDREDGEAAAGLEAQLTLPGWNTWTGPGTETLKANRKRKERLESLKRERDAAKRKRLRQWPLVKRMDEEEANECVRKLRVSDLPFPFASTGVFEANLEAPLGKEWNPESVHRSLIRSGTVKTKMGAVIKPISREVAMKKNKGGAMKPPSTGRTGKQTGKSPKNKQNTKKMDE